MTDKYKELRELTEKATPGRKVRTMEIPLRPGDKQDPLITNTMKAYCNGEYSWQEQADYYDENGNVVEHIATRTVPWDLCKAIYKQMATMANASPEMEGATNPAPAVPDALRTIASWLDTDDPEFCGGPTYHEAEMIGMAISGPIGCGDAHRCMKAARGAFLEAANIWERPMLAASKVE